MDLAQVQGVVALGMFLIILLLVYRCRRGRRELESLLATRTEELEREKRVGALRGARLADQENARTELLTHISQELRTPLSLILAPLRDFTEGRLGALGPEAGREMGRMRANAARLVELVDQILDTAQIEAGSLRLRVVREDLSALINLVAGRFLSVAERCQINLRVTVPEEPVWLWFDPEQFDKVLTHLLSNAFKFTPRGGRIRVSVKRPVDGRVEVSVRDTGRGIPATDLPQLLDRFHHASQTHTRRYPGTGLGLTLVRKLVEIHGGDLDVRSEPGLGATFTISLRTGHDHFHADQMLTEEDTDLTSTWSSTAASFMFSQGLVVVEAVSEAASTELANVAQIGEEVARDDREQSDKSGPLVELETGTDVNFLARVHAVIDAQLTDEDFNVDALAARLAMSRSLLYLRLEEIGRSPASLILDHRLRHAANLLRGGEAPVGEVAHAVGFKSVSHFTQRFRRRYGMTPSAYRRHRA